MAKDFKFENFDIKKKDGKEYIYVKNVKPLVKYKDGDHEAPDTHIYICVSKGEGDYGKMYRAKNDNFDGLTELNSIEPEPEVVEGMPPLPAPPALPYEWSESVKGTGAKLPSDPKDDFKKVKVGPLEVDLSALKKVLEDNKTKFGFFGGMSGTPKTFWDNFDLEGDASFVGLVKITPELKIEKNYKDCNAVLLKSKTEPLRHYLYTRDDHKLQECVLDTSKDPNEVKLEADKFVNKDGKLGDGIGDNFDLLKSGIDLAKILNGQFLMTQLVSLYKAGFIEELTVNSGLGTAKFSDKKGYVFKNQEDEFYYFVFNDGKGVAKCGKNKPSAESLAKMNLGAGENDAQIFNTETYAFVNDKDANASEVNSDALKQILEEGGPLSKVQKVKVEKFIENLKLEYVENIDFFKEEVEEGGKKVNHLIRFFIHKRDNPDKTTDYYLFGHGKYDFLISCGKTKPDKEYCDKFVLGGEKGPDLKYLNKKAIDFVSDKEDAARIDGYKIYYLAESNTEISILNLTDGKKLTVAKNDSADTAGLSEKSGYLFKGVKFYYFILDNGEGIVRCGKVSEPEPTAEDLAKIKLGDGENDAQIFDIKNREFNKKNKLEDQDVKATKDLVVIKKLLDEVKSKGDPNKENTPVVSGDNFPKTLKFKYGKDDVEVKFDKYGCMLNKDDATKFVKYKDGKVEDATKAEDIANVRDFMDAGGFLKNKISGLVNNFELADEEIKETGGKTEIKLTDIKGSTKTIEISKKDPSGLSFKIEADEVKIKDGLFDTTGSVIDAANLEVTFGTETKKLTEAIKNQIKDENLKKKLGLEGATQPDKFKFDGFEVDDKANKDYLKVTLKYKEDKTSKSVVVWVDKNKKSYADDGNKPKSGEIKIKLDTKTGFSFGNDGNKILEFLKEQKVPETDQKYKQIDNFKGAAVENKITCDKSKIEVGKDKPGFAKVELLINEKTTAPQTFIYVSYPGYNLFSELDGTGENTKGKTPINSINAKTGKIDFTGGTNQISIYDETKLVNDLGFLKGLKKALEDVAFKPNFEYKLDDANNTPEQLEKLKKEDKRAKVLMTATAAGLKKTKQLWVDVKGDVFDKEKDKNPLKQIVGFDGKDIQFDSKGDNLKASSFKLKDLNEKFLNKEANYTLKHTLATVNDKNKKYAAKLTVQVMNGTTALTAKDAKKDFYVAKNGDGKAVVYTDENITKHVYAITSDSGKVNVDDVAGAGKTIFELKDGLLDDQTSKNVLKDLLKSEEPPKDDVKFEVLNGKKSKEIKFGSPEKTDRFYVVKAAIANKTNKFFLIEEEYRKIYECTSENGSGLDVNKPLIEFKLSGDKKSVEVKAATKADDEKAIVLKKGDAKINKIPEALFDALKDVDVFKKIFEEPAQDQKKVKFELAKDANNTKVLKLGATGHEKDYYLVKATLADDSTKFFLIGKEDKKIYECSNDKGGGFDIKKPLTKFNVKEENKSLDILSAKNEEEAKKAIVVNKKEINIPNDLKTVLGALEDFKFFKPIEPPKKIKLTFEIDGEKLSKVGEKEMEAYKIKMKVDEKDEKSFVIAKDGLLWSIDGKAKVHIGINGEIDNNSQSDAVHDEHLAGLLALILANDKDFFGEDVAKKQVLFNQSGTLIEDKIENIEIEVPDENGNNTKLSIGVPKTIVGVVPDVNKPDDVVYFDSDTLFITDKDGKVNESKKIYEHDSIKDKLKDADKIIFNDNNGKAVSVNLAVSRAEVILVSQEIFDDSKNSNISEFQKEQAMLIKIIGEKGYDAILGKLMNFIAKGVAEGKLSKDSKPEDVKAFINKEISMNPWIKYGVSIAGGAAFVGTGATGILSVAGVLALANPLVAIGLLVGSGVLGTGTLVTCLISRYKALSNEKNLYNVESKTEEKEKINPFKKIVKMKQAQQKGKNNDEPDV